MSSKTPAPSTSTPSESEEVKVPNVVPKRDPKEQQKMEAMMGRLKDEKQQNLFIVDQTGKTETFDAPSESQDGVLNLKAVPIVYMKNCKKGNYTFNRRTTKFFIENCEDVTVTVNQNVLTNTIEAWKGGGLTLNVNTDCKTLQLDMLKKVAVTFKQHEHMGCIVWNQLEDFAVQFADRKDQSVSSGLEEAKKKWQDSNEVDQFIIRFHDGKCLEERCIRLKNGHLSTEREAIDWDKRNTTARQKYMDQFMKEAGIHLNKSEGKAKLKPNDPCSCNSGKKYKKCCMNLKTAEGIAGKTVVYKK
eukprot:gb/GEZN01009241.1/.p1 GENE.gb/GEZN01009241.1/~~gb/GEZN01009241.1/.p1  ORF type:complete len:302 (+),score=55.17 gb/GEZN01009241.1/:36-941(+)